MLRSGPGEGEPEQLSLPYGRPLRHPRCRTAGVCSVPAGAGDQQERTGELFSAAHRLRRAGDRGKVEDYLARYDVPAREQTDVRWAQTCMTLEDTVEQLGAQLSPVLVRRMQDKLWQALYFGYDYAAPFLPQLEKNLHWLDVEFAKLTEYQQKRNNASK